jgi:hypothetical protein
VGVLRGGRSEGRGPHVRESEAGARAEVRFREASDEFQTMGMIARDAGSNGRITDAL